MIIESAKTEQKITSTILVSLLVLASTAVAMSFRTIPVLSADEIGYLAEAQTLATRIGANMQATRFYFGGYSLLLAPFDWILQNPRDLYRAAILLNSVILAATVPVLLRLAVEFGLVDDPRLPWLAGLLVLWPSQFFQAYLALPEVGLRFLMLALIAVIFPLFRSAKWQHGLLLGTLTGVAYAFHPRSLVVLPLVIVIIGVAIRCGTLPWRVALLSLGIMAVGVIAADRLNLHFRIILWGQDASEIGTLRLFVEKLAAAPAATLLRIFGHFWYQMVATLLLAPLGLVVAVRLILRKDRLDRRVACIFAIFLTAGMGIAGAVNMIKPETIDWLIYSRFLDIVTPFFVWLALVALLDASWQSRLAHWVAPLAAVALAGAIVLYLRYAPIVLPGVNLVEIGGLAPLARMDWLISDTMTRVLLFAPVVLVTVSILVFTLFRQKTFLLVGLTAYVGVMAYDIDQLYRGSNIGGEARLAQARALYARAGNSPIHMDMSQRGGDVFIHQFMLGTRFERTDLAKSPAESGTVTIVSAETAAVTRGICLAELSDGNRLIRLDDTPMGPCPP